MQGFIATLLTLVTIGCLSGCYSQPINIEEAAKANRWDLSYQKGRHYPTVLVSSRVPGNHSNLHVYLEGDGLPWKTSKQISSNPTPRNPVALNLMKYDDGHAIYLGRPCYFGLHEDSRCNPSLWTFARYSESVVQELNNAIDRYLDQTGLNHAILVGFSGGGTLALLLANRNPRIKGALMIAPNFDTSEWVRLHDYSTLNASLNPAREPKAHPYKEVFWFGEEDVNVPAIPFAGIAKQRTDAQVRRFKHVDHACCWEDLAQSGELQRALRWIEDDGP
ncbi:MAG: hypothetical protein RLZ25_738 [Pseudomonadota bacterium]